MGYYELGWVYGISTHRILLYLTCRGRDMGLWMDLLFGNWIGILSMFTIGFIIVMAIWMWSKFLSLSKTEGQ